MDLLHAIRSCLFVLFSLLVVLTRPPFIVGERFLHILSSTIPNYGRILILDEKHLDLDLVRGSVRYSAWSCSPSGRLVFPSDKLGYLFLYSVALVTLYADSFHAVLPAFSADFYKIVGLAV